MSSVINSNTSLDYCINKAIPDGSSLYYATIFDKGNNKTIIITLHAFLHELTDIIHECSDPGVARIKLAWWQEEIERRFNKQARHPVTRQMQQCIDVDEHLKSTFDSIIEFFNHFLFIEQTDSLDTILSLYKSTTGEIWSQTAKLLAATNIDTMDLLREMGALFHFISCLQQPQTYINEIRCIIPATYIDHTELLQLRTNSPKNHAKQKEIFSPLLSELTSRLDETYKKLKAKDSIEFQHALIMNRLSFKTCEEILRDGCNLLDTNINLTPVRKLWIAWWTHFSIK